MSRQLAEALRRTRTDAAKSAEIHEWGAKRHGQRWLEANMAAVSAASGSGLPPEEFKVPIAMIVLRVLDTTLTKDEWAAWSERREKERAAAHELPKVAITTRFKNGILYVVQFANGDHKWVHFVRFGRAKPNRAGGPAFVAAAQMQEREAGEPHTESIVNRSNEVYI